MNQNDFNYHRIEVPSGVYEYLMNHVNEKKTLINLIKEGNDELVYHLITACDVDVNVVDDDGISALMWACFKKKHDYVELLVKQRFRYANANYKIPKQIITKDDKLILKGTTAINIAVCKNDLESVKILAPVSDLNIGVEHFGYKIDMVPLEKAVRKGNLDIIKVLACCDPNLNANRYSSNLCSLAYLLKENRAASIIKLLLDAKYDPNVMNNRDTLNPLEVILDEPLLKCCINSEYCPCPDSLSNIDAALVLLNGGCRILEASSEQNNKEIKNYYEKVCALKKYLINKNQILNEEIENSKNVLKTVQTIATNEFIVKF